MYRNDETDKPETWLIVAVSAAIVLGGLVALLAPQSPLSERSQQRRATPAPSACYSDLSTAELIAITNDATADRCAP